MLVRYGTNVIKAKTTTIPRAVFVGEKFNLGAREVEVFLRRPNHTDAALKGRIFLFHFALLSVDFWLHFSDT